MPDQPELLLAGDIGGTKANLVLVDPAGDPRQPVFAARLATSDHPSLESLLEAFLAKAGLRARWLCLGIPAPVVDGRVAPVNIPWQAQEDEIASGLGFARVRFLNDLVTTALGIPELAADEIVTIHAGTPQATGPKVVIAPGTGLGLAYLLHDGHRYQAYPSEGGHADFAPRGERQRRLQAFLALHDQTHLEAVCSGKGIANLWRFFAAEGLRDSPAIESATQTAADPTPLIMAAAEDPVANPRSAAAADEFIAILMQEAGNCALRWLATGGVYFAGGVTPKVLARLRQPAVLPGFLSNPHLGRVLAGIPLRAVTNEQTAVLGAIAGGRAMIRHDLGDG